MRASSLPVTLACLILLPTSTIAQEAKDRASEESAVQKHMANIAAMGPGVHEVRKNKKGRIVSCFVVGQSRISTALGKAKGLEVARKRADLNASAEFVKWLKQDVTVVENNEDETVTLLEGTEEQNKDALKESGKAVEKIGSKMTSTAQGLVRGLQGPLHVGRDGENKQITVVKGWNADTAEGVTRIVRDLNRGDPKSADRDISKPDSKKNELKKGDKEISDSEVTSPDADEFLRKKKDE